jgi:hypothetical protein
MNFMKQANSVTRNRTHTNAQERTRTHTNALCGELALILAMDLSQDSLRDGGGDDDDDDDKYLCWRRFRIGCRGWH